ncbi:MAG: prenyltransferase/squalene oxidase repeat-containing protein [Verrucomicrobiota bacterium]
MLQVARRGVLALGDSVELVRKFILSKLGESGAGVDRDGNEDLYYTIFALACLNALDEPIPKDALRVFLRRFANGETLDFVHLGALARCWSVVGSVPEEVAEGILRRIETFRSMDGAYESEVSAAEGNAYGCFVALGAYQDLGRQLPAPLRVVQALKSLETPDGAWGNVRGLRTGSTNATAAAVTLLHQLDMPVSPQVGRWLLAQQHWQGGFLAMPNAPIPDLLSTATALHALACLDMPLPRDCKDATLDFLDTLWSADGGFHGHWVDDFLDVEYTFYGLLALGHLL